MGEQEPGPGPWRSVTDRRTFLMGLAAGAVLLPSASTLLEACTQGSSPGTTTAGPPSKPTGTLRAAVPGIPNFIDPTMALEITEWSTCRNVYDGLIEWNSDYTQLVPGLADSWQSNSDATEWTFNLKKGIQFHDGQPFNSSAVRKTIEYYQGKTWGLIWANVSHVDDSDPNVVKISFSAPSPDLARNQTLGRIISPKLIADNAVGTKAVGTGPFSFVNWDKTSGITLDAHDGWWGKNGPYLKEIQFRFISDNTAALTALTAGDLDLVMKVPPPRLKDFQNNSKFAISSINSWLEGHLIFRCDQPIVNDVRVRQGIAYAIDRESIVNNVLLNQATVATSPEAPGCYGKTDPPTSYALDKNKSRALLKAAGFDTGPNLKMSTAALIRVMGEEVAQAIVAQLQDAGINVKGDVQEAGVYLGDLFGDHPTHQLFHVEYGWANGGPFHYTLGTALGHPRYKGAELTALIAKVATTADGDQRLALIAQTEDLFMKELPHLPLYHVKLSDVFRASLVGYQNPRDGYLPFFGRAYLSS